MNSELTVDKMLEHFGHEVLIVKYGDQNIALECTDCNEVLADSDIDEHKWYTVNNNTDVQWCHNCDATKDSDGGIIV